MHTPANAQRRNDDWRYEEDLSPSGCMGQGRLVNPNGGRTVEPAGCEGGCTLSLMMGGHPNLTSLDWTNCAVWIEGPDKRGYLVLGQLTDGYNSIDPSKGHAAYWGGRTTCCHGVESSPRIPATGPGTTWLSHWAWLYDPADFGAVIDGKAQPYTPQPYWGDLATRLGDWGVQLQRGARTYYQLISAWFEPTSRKLYVTDSLADSAAGAYFPVVHRFSVNC
jgi:hypothetical protein